MEVDMLMRHFLPRLFLPVNQRPWLHFARLASNGDQRGGCGVVS